MNECASDKRIEDYMSVSVCKRGP